MAKSHKIITTHIDVNASFELLRAREISKPIQVKTHTDMDTSFEAMLII